MKRDNENSAKHFIRELEDKALESGITDKPLSDERKTQLEVKIEATETELAERLTETTRIVFDLDRALELLEQDIGAICDGWTLNIAIDYHELYRYLHPCLDTERHDPERFYVAQLVLSYLFNVSDEKLLLLPMYLSEFKSSLRVIRSDFEALYTREYKTRRQQEVIRFVERLLKQELTPHADELVKQYSLDVLVESSTELGLKRAMDCFADLVSRGKIYFVEQIKDFEPPLLVEQYVDEFEPIYHEMVKCRPEVERYEPNITDAKAALWVKKTNELNFDKRKAFVLVSSSVRIKPAFQSVKLPLTKGGKTFQSTILRDLYYFLFRYYFCSENYSQEKITENIRRTRSLFGEYMKSMAEIHMKTLEITLQDIDKTNILPLYSRVLSVLWKFEVFMAERTSFRPIKPLSDKEIFSIIAKFSQDEQALRRSVKYALDALESSTTALDKIYNQIKTRAEDGRAYKE